MVESVIVGVDVSGSSGSVLVLSISMCTAAPPQTRRLHLYRPRVRYLRRQDGGDHKLL